MSAVLSDWQMNACVGAAFLVSEAERRFDLGEFEEGFGLLELALELSPFDRLSSSPEGCGGAPCGRRISGEECSECGAGFLGRPASERVACGDAGLPTSRATAESSSSPAAECVPPVAHSDLQPVGEEASALGSAEQMVWDASVLLGRAAGFFRIVRGS